MEQHSQVCMYCNWTYTILGSYVGGWRFKHYDLKKYFFFNTNNIVRYLYIQIEALKKKKKKEYDTA